MFSWIGLTSRSRQKQLDESIQIRPPYSSWHEYIEAMHISACLACSTVGMFPTKESRVTGGSKLAVLWKFHELPRHDSFTFSFDEFFVLDLYTTQRRQDRFRPCILFSGVNRWWLNNSFQIFLCWIQHWTLTIDRSCWAGVKTQLGNSMWILWKQPLEDNGNFNHCSLTFDMSNVSLY